MSLMIDRHLPRSQGHIALRSRVEHAISDAGHHDLVLAADDVADLLAEVHDLALGVLPGVDLMCACPSRTPA